jgi:hypothetical protein
VWESFEGELGPVLVVHTQSGGGGGDGETATPAQ